MLVPLALLATVVTPTLANVVAEDCQDGNGLSFLQHGLHVPAARGKNIPDHDPMINLDENGRLCFLCAKPSLERAPGQTWVQRTDCGNHSLLEHPEVKYMPLRSFMREATAEHNATNGWCELNVEKGCADALYNRDYLMFAKGVFIPDLPFLHYKTSSWDMHYCYYNGWLAPEIRALQHDFDGLTAKGEEYCKSDSLVQKGSLGNITMMDFTTHYLPGYPGYPGGKPTPENAHHIAAWACAMGSAACDMAYCAYTYCVKGDSFGAYEECEGWDPIAGMPVHS